MSKRKPNYVVWVKIYAQNAIEYYEHKLFESRIEFYSISETAAKKRINNLLKKEISKIKTPLVIFSIDLEFEKIDY